MKILMISHMHYPTVGGVQNVVDNLSQQCIKKGHSVEIVTSLYPKDLPRSEIINGIKVTRLPFRLPELSVLSFVKFFVRAIDCIISLLFFAKKIDLVNLHYISENAPYAIFISKVLRIPLITNIHGSDIELFSLRNSFNKHLVRQTLLQSSCIISNSKSLLQTTCRIYGEELFDKAVVVGNGINLSKFGEFHPPLRSEHPYIIGIGRLETFKGFDLLLESFRLVIDRFPGITLVLIGDGPERERLEDLARALKLENSISFLGRIANDNALRILGGSEFLVSPSRREAFGIVNLEAMAAQKAVIARDVGGVTSYLYPMKNGLLVKEQSPEPLADAIIFLLERPGLARQFGINGRKMIESKYTWEIIANRYLETFQSVL